MIHARTQKLSNGLRLLLVPMRESASVTVAVFVRAGSSYETAHNNGVSHFLEHMCFKGTDKYPRAIDISSALESIGAEHNAMTDRDFTGYYAKTASRYFERALDVVSELYLHPHIDEQEMQKEKGVIIEEIHMYEDNPRYKVSETLEHGLYGNQPAGWGIAGTEAHIARMNRDMFTSYRDTRYVPGNTVIVVAGAFDPRLVRREIKKRFETMHGHAKTDSASHIQQRVSGGKILITPKPLDQTHLALGFYAQPLASEKRFEISMLAKILGGSMSSRLFQHVREELGAAYYVGASNNVYATHGYMDVYAGVNHQKLEQALKAIMREIEIIRNYGVTKEELQRAQDYAIGTFLLSLESSSDLAFYYGPQAVVSKNILTPQDVITRIKRISIEDVHAQAKNILRLDRMRFSIVGPYRKNEEKRFSKLLRG
jgi:predicted Zn-dependent peptidase